MRLLVLYSRSRRLPTAAAAALLGAIALDLAGWAFWQGHADVRSMTFAITLGVAAASVGLVGADVMLERTASLRWRPRRAAHLIGLGVVVAGFALAATGILRSPAIPAEVIIRDVAGQVGLLGVGAVLLGGSFGWVFPLVAMMLPNLPMVANDTPLGVGLTWLVQPSQSTTANLVGFITAAIGLVIYSVLGCWRR
jgi:hypothetical protein